MEYYKIHFIKNSPLVYNYLREHSEVYKDLIRDKISLKELENRAKNHYKQTPMDKVNEIVNSINMISSIMDVLK